jgi:hypothetical protein
MRPQCLSRAKDPQKRRNDQMGPVHGTSSDPAVPGVLGDNKTGIGVGGESDTNDAVHGNSNSSNAAGVSGFNVRGVLNTHDLPPAGPGVLGHSKFGAGVVGDSDQFDGVFGVSHTPTAAGVSGHNPGGLAGFFDGDVTITGHLNSQLVNNLQQQLSSLQQQLSSLQQKESSLQQQLSSLQQKEATDVQGIANSLVTLAERVTALGG